MNARPEARLTLVSHALCPYVQRAAIVLAEKGVPFERHDVDLAAKPAWFLAVSPLGKTPVLLVDGAPVFESAVICDYLDEVHPPRLHPADALERARHRGWIEVASQALNGIAAVYNAPTDDALAARLGELAARFARLEATLGDGPFFAGARFSIVDAAWAPVFRYFDVIDRVIDPSLFEHLPKLGRWRGALAARPSVRRAVGDDYAQRLTAFLLARGSALARRLGAATAVTAPA
jgi:glutathione S-transferase